VERAIARDVTFHVHGNIDWNFQAIDATPQFTTQRISRMEDLCHFAAPLVRTQRIIPPEENVPELLESILKLQQPAKTDRLREEMRSPDGLRCNAIPQQRFQAEIISVAA
jgi:hypothetical protein